MEKTIEIPLGAKDSELKGWEYTIPEGMVAEIKDGKIIVREKESEDERIRKELINYFNDFNLPTFGGLDPKKILAWLEKQGSQNLANSEKTCKDEQNPAWSEEDEKNIEKLDGFLTEVFCYGHVYVSQKDKEELQSWLKSLKERCTWRPSGEQMRALEDAKMRMSLDGYGLCPLLQTLINDLKKLKG